ncbi:MAG TPA: DUF6311 domain-containing protein [Candidatus Magasanikbacteria bacterium]|nr:DUF6311 domain-containing protein [Candidatus Magasanikbacteria bacterium]
MTGGLKKAVNFFQRWPWWGLVVAGILGGLVFFVFLGQTFWPQNIDWILADGSDTFQHQIGWEFFRASPWVWPWGIIKNLNYPTGVSILYTDSLPLLAIIFKLIRQFLPSNFQYLGLWMFLCFVLQGMGGFLLMRLIKKDTILDILGSLFFVLSPIIFQRAAGHTSLVSHFIILAALFLCLSRPTVLSAWRWGVVLVLAWLTHPYIFFMIVPFWLVEQIRLYKSTSKKKLWRDNLILLVILILLSWSIGLTSGEGSADGFGDFSLNLNALVNPLGWSNFLPQLPIQEHQFEGFNYLGLGLILLGIFSGSWLVIKRREVIIALGKKFWPVFVVVLFLFFLALSNKIYFNQHLIFSYSLPAIIEKILNCVRSSGRLFWPVYYLLMIGALFSLRFFKKTTAIIIISLALVIQITDLSVGLKEKRNSYSVKVKKFQSQTTFNQEYETWKNLLANYQHVVILPYFNRYDMALSWAAAKNNQTFTAGAFARQPIGLNSFINNQVIKVCSGNFDSETAYLFFDNLYQCLPKLEKTTPSYSFNLVYKFLVLLPQK